MFKAELIERVAHFRSADDDPLRDPAHCPALVLNADYTPLSYYPLSLWPWQTAVKAVFLERVDIVANYEREVHSPSLDMKIPSVIALRQFVKPSEFPAFTRFNVPWVWKGQVAFMQSRAIDETGMVQPTYEELRKVRGTRSVYHNNAIQTWQVEENGDVRNVQLANS